MDREVKDKVRATDLPLAYGNPPNAFLPSCVPYSQQIPSRLANTCINSQKRILFRCLSQLGATNSQIGAQRLPFAYPDHRHADVIPGISAATSTATYCFKTIFTLRVNAVGDHSSVPYPGTCFPSFGPGATEYRTSTVDLE